MEHGRVCTHLLHLKCLCMHAPNREYLLSSPMWWYLHKVQYNISEHDTWLGVHLGCPKIKYIGLLYDRYLHQFQMMRCLCLPLLLCKMMRCILLLWCNAFAFHCYDKRWWDAFCCYDIRCRCLPLLWYKMAMPSAAAAMMVILKFYIS
jgi:hypothetical protein